MLVTPTTRRFPVFDTTELHALQAAEWALDSQ